MKSKLLYLILLFAAFAVSLNAQEASEGAEAELTPFQKELQAMNWQNEGTGDLDGLATIEIPEGYSFIQKKDTRRLMELFGNIPTEIESGLICPEDLSWFVVFEFSKEGYVKDDEKDSLDADAILKDLKAGNAAGNERRQEMGLETLTLVGWAVPPNYNPATNNLEWAIQLQGEDGGITVNFFTKLLGRRGIMNATLVCDPNALESILPDYQQLLTNYSYTSGNTYAEFKEGDKIAKYGLTGLIAGGALFAAAKTGFLAKFLKPILIGLAVVGGAIAKFFKKIVGRE
ncbi:MAG: DUF2167 domain-containing protein [Verrucomicrobia bacterium]|nr:DUF2167 domain-containing protein [Verrucomicrobiota bacterium]MDA1066570.1 DUF2167 domain-containing protein [Verrucomicrobiota bacterium]